MRRVQAELEDCVASADREAANTAAQRRKLQSLAARSSELASQLRGADDLRASRAQQRAALQSQVAALESDAAAAQQRLASAGQERAAVLTQINEAIEVWNPLCGVQQHKLIVVTLFTTLAGFGSHGKRGQHGARAAAKSACR